MDALPAAYAGVDLLLANLTRREGGDRRMLHLGIEDVVRLVAGTRPKLAILTHFGMQLVRDRPETVALRISDRTGIPTIAARDGMTIPLPPRLDLPTKVERPRRTAAKVRE
jgi:phosphoribosyl 1,2-cyclic phosphodiesterase